MDMVERVRAAILTALSHGNGYTTPTIGDMRGNWRNPRTGDMEFVDRVRIDGEFDLQDVARAAIAAMRRPTDEMAEFGLGCIGSDISEVRDMREAWGMMIDLAQTNDIFPKFKALVDEYAKANSLNGFSVRYAMFSGSIEGLMFYGRLPNGSLGGFEVSTKELRLNDGKWDAVLKSKIANAEWRSSLSTNTDPQEASSE